MHISKRRLIAGILVAIGSAVILGTIPGRAHAEDPPGPNLSATEFAQLSRELRLGNQPWATIPWKVSVTEARQLAALQGKPIFLVVNTGNCLGWT
jgi:hypothetical protein